MSKNSKITSGDPFLEREKANYDEPIASREHLLELVQAKKVPLPQEDIAETLGYDDETRQEALRRRLQAMVRDGQLLRNRKNLFGLAKEMGMGAKLEIKNDENNNEIISQRHFHLRIFKRGE